MQPKLTLLCTLIALPVCAAEVTPAFQQLFAKHQAAGTLLSRQAGEEFQRQGWGEPFQRAVSTKLRSAEQRGLSVEITPAPGATARVGQPFQLRWAVRNGGKAAAKIQYKGSCRTVHGVSLVVIEPDGKVVEGVFRSAVGRHCFCSQQSRAVSPGEAIPLEMEGSTASYVPYQPSKPGRYVLVARYNAAVDKTEVVHLQSRPLEVTVTGQTASR